MLRWETNLDCSLSIEKWGAKIDNLRQCTCSTSIRKTPIKLHTRLHMTPSKIHCFYPLASPCYFRGFPDQGTFMHIFGSCKFLQPLWQQTATKVLQLAGKQSPYPTSMPLICFHTQYTHPLCVRLLHTLFSSIQWMIAYNWCSPSLPWPQVLARMKMIKLSERIY